MIPPNFFTEIEGAVFPCAPSDWQLLYVSGLDTDRQASQMAVCDVTHVPQLTVAQTVRRCISYVPQMHRTTNAYFLTAEGARALMHHCIPLTFQLDTAMTTMLSGPLLRTQFPFQQGVNAFPCYTVQPSMIVQATRFGTDIQQEAHSMCTHPEAEETARFDSAGWHPDAIAGKP